MDKASQALAEILSPGVPRSFRARADRCNVPRTTLQHRARGRRSVEEKAQAQQYLYPWEEKALVKFFAQQDALGRPVRIKDICSIAFALACRRDSSRRPSKPPCKNWPQSFYKRHPSLRASRNAALDWNRYDIYDKVLHWFEVMGIALQDAAFLQENIYNMDETGVMLSKLNGVKVLVCKTHNPGYRGTRVKRTMVTAIECVSADGRYLHPMIIWPASTHRSNWTTYPTPGWHYAFSDTGYTDSFLSLQWLKLVFDPQTKNRANKKPRVLICDGFGTHESLEILEFCFENNIVLCRLPSHTSHKLQPLDISVFGPLKAAYRDQLERLERGYVGAVGKEHFTYLYWPAREQAFTSRNIRAGWAKSGLFPFNPDRVLKDIRKPVANSMAPTSSEAHVSPSASEHAPQTPATPASARGVTFLHELIKQDSHQLDEVVRQRLHRRVQKLADATQVSFAERSLLQEQNHFLSCINNEAKVRRSTKSEVIGTARVMSYEDLEKARAARAAKDAKKAAKRTEKETGKTAYTTQDAEPAPQDKPGKGRKGKKAKIGEDPTVDVAETNDGQQAEYRQEAEEPEEPAIWPCSEEDGGPPATWTVPVARMW